MIKVVRQQDRPRYDTPGGNTTTPVATPSVGATELLVVRQEQAPGGANPMHAKSTEAVIYVLDGVVHVATETTTSLLSAGDAAVVPSGTLHQYRNAGEAPARWLVLTPGDVRFSDAGGDVVVPAWLT